MKKVIYLILSIVIILTLVLSLASCSQDTSKVRIGVLNGTTGIGIAKLYSDIKNNSETQYEISVYSDQMTMQADISAGNLDIAAMATSDAAVYYNSNTQKQAPIQIAAVNTLSVLYVVTTETDINSLDDLSGKTVYLPTPEGQSPDVIFRALLAKKGLTNKVTLVNSASPSALLPQVIKGNAKIAVMPEPLVTNATAKLAQNGLTLRNIIDIGKEWGDEAPIAQGCLVVRSDFVKEHKSLVKQFLSDYKESVEYISNPENLDSAAKLVSEMTDLGMTEAVAKKALPNCKLACITGKEMKNTLEPFYSAIYNINRDSINGAIPDDDFYYTK